MIGLLGTRARDARREPESTAASPACPAVQPVQGAALSQENVRRRKITSAHLLGASLLVGAVAFTALFLGKGFAPTVTFFFAGILVAAVLALWGAVEGATTLVGQIRSRKAVGTAGVVAAVLGNLLMVGFGALVAFFATVGFARGRQLRRWGRILLPSVAVGGAWEGWGIHGQKLEQDEYELARQHLVTRVRSLTEAMGRVA